jgi:hypothetical protein
MSAPNWWGDWRPILTPHTGNLQPTDLLECTSIVGGLPVNTAITGAQIIAAASGGAATWGSITGTISAQTDLQGELDNKVPYTGATADVNLGSHDLTATQGTFATGGSSDTLTVNHTSGSGKAITITKGGSGEGIYVNKTSGSGNAVTIVGDLEATTIKKTSGTSTQFLKADGSVDTTTYQPTLVSGTNIKTVNGNSLLGSGNIAVSSNPRTLASLIGSNLVGTANQISTSYRIAGGTLVANNTIYIQSLLTKTAGSTNSIGRIYINTTNSLTGATLLATAAQMTGTVYIQNFRRNIFFDGTNLNVYLTTGFVSSDLTTGGIALIPFNPAIDYFLIFAVQNSSTTPDNLGHKRVIIQLYD